MWYGAASQIVSGLVLSAVAIAVQAGGIRTSVGRGTLNPAPRSSEIMLYFSRPVGGGGGMSANKPTFGFRLDQVRVNVEPITDSTDVGVNRKQLLSFHLRSRSDMRVDVGNVMSWDVSRGAFGSTKSMKPVEIEGPPSRSGMMAGGSTQASARGASTATARSTMQMSSFAPSFAPTTRETFRESQTSNVFAMAQAAALNFHSDQIRAVRSTATATHTSSGRVLH